MPEELVIKTYDADIKAIEGERALNVTITTTKKDRDGDIVEAKGAKLANYRKNPVVLMAHDYRGLSIARTDTISKEEDKIKAKITFPPEGDYPLADIVHKLYKGKFMRAWSIGFIPIKSEDIVDEEDEGKGGIDIVRRGRRIKTWELLEFSACAIPSNPEALTNMVAKGIDLEPLKEAGFIEIEEEGEEIKFSDVEKPYPNEHACRIRSPGDFKPESFKRISRTSDGKKYSVIMGRLKGETTLTEQAYRYDKGIWSVAQARKHCKDHEGIAFEPATEKEEESKEDKLKEIGLFDVNGIYETIKESKELKLKVDELNKNIKELELKAGAVLNAKNKQDLKNAQNLIQSVLDSAEVNEDSLEIEDEKDSKEDDSAIELEDSKVDDKLIDEEKDKDKIEVDEKVIAKAIDEKMSYLVGKVKQSDTKNKR